MGKLSLLKAAAVGLAFYGAMAGASHAADIVGLITKTEGNPFFVKMREGAQAKAKELGLDLHTFAGESLRLTDESRLRAAEVLQRVVAHHQHGRAGGVLGGHDSESIQGRALGCFPLTAKVIPQGDTDVGGWWHHM